MKVKLNIPYPEIKVEKENLYYAELLSQDYAGIVSEATASMPQATFKNVFFIPHSPYVEFVIILSNVIAKVNE